MNNEHDKKKASVLCISNNIPHYDSYLVYPLKQRNRCIIFSRSFNTIRTIHDNTKTENIRRPIDLAHDTKKPAGPLSSFALTVCQVDWLICVFPVNFLGQKAFLLITASPSGREGARPRGCGEKGDTCLPRGVTQGWGSGKTAGGTSDKLE